MYVEYKDKWPNDILILLTFKINIHSGKLSGVHPLQAEVFTFYNPMAYRFPYCESGSYGYNFMKKRTGFYCAQPKRHRIENSSNSKERKGSQEI